MLRLKTVLQRKKEKTVLVLEKFQGFVGWWVECVLARDG
jgi:hypothetical protein